MFRISRTYVIILLLYLFGKLLANKIFDSTDVFHAQHCQLGFNSPGTRTIPCTTVKPQQNIIRTGIALVEYEKSLAPYIYRFDFSLSYQSEPTTVFNIFVEFLNPTAGINLGIFIIIIKDQPNQQFVDLVNYSNYFSLNVEWITGSLIDNFNNDIRQENTTFDLRTDTIFTTGAVSLIAVPFVSSFRLSVAGNDRTRLLQFKITAQFSDPFLNIKVTAFNYNKYQIFSGSALIFNPSAIPLGQAKGWNINYLIQQYQINPELQIDQIASSYGPNFDSKCFLGFYQFDLKMQYTWKYNFTRTPGLNISTYKDFGLSPTKHFGYLVCFGNNSVCGEYFPYFDAYTDDCYTSSTCPLPVFTGWNLTTLCPNCTQLICDQCDPIDRSKCTICKPNTHSHLSGNTCVCDTNYVQVTLSIDTASSGLWNNLTPSVLSCQLNCSAVITGCMQNDCLNASFCTVCKAASNYVLLLHNSTDQTCVLCSVQILRCTTCVNITHCTACSEGSYLFSTASAGSCPLCSSAITHCTNCSDQTTCTLCDPGYVVDTTSNQCICDETFDLLNCQGCTVSGECDNCVELLFFLNTTTLKCQPCSDIHPSCTACSNEFTCTSCSQEYALDSIASPGSTTCNECRATIDNCKWCQSSSVCTDCDIGYLLNASTIQCDCDHTFNSLQHCQSCLVPQNCHICVSLYFLNTTTLICRPCSDIHPSCTDCLDENTCTSCSFGFALDQVTKVGSVTCRECGKFINNCTLCSSSSVCTDCDYFYGLDGSSCKLCNQLVMPGCEACENSSPCLKCDSQTRMINQICHYCHQISNCVDCIVSISNVLWCTVCNTGYFLTYSQTKSIPQCKSCQNVFSFCKQCSSSNQCTACLSPYFLGSTGLCDKCEKGYEFIEGFCLSSAGCISPIFKNGKEICLACVHQLNFVLDTKQMKCVCDIGYIEYHQIGFLTKCIPLCGDGIVLAFDQDCDDNNTVNDDGCDQNCSLQPGFQCQGQPTSCVLSHIVEHFQYNYVVRLVPQNKAKFSFKIQPPVKAFQNLKWQQMITLQFFSEKAVQKSQISFQYSIQTSELFVTIPYQETLENTILQASLELDPTIIKSSKRQYFLDGKMINGRNVPLTYDQSSIQSTSENIQTLSMIMIVLVLVQFYLGSLTHKMIGLQTIQIIQTLYFSRMIAPSNSTSLLQSMNSIQYSASGYQNSNLIFGKNLTSLILSESYDTMSPQFTSINLQKYFLLNINFALIPVVIVIVWFFVKLRQKIVSRNLYLETKQQELKDKYTQIRRSFQWVYDHTFFPFIMMFNMVCFFGSVLYFRLEHSDTKNQSIQILEIASYSTIMFMQFATLAIYCYEILVSLEEFKQFRLTQREKQRKPKSLVQKLQYDQNYQGRANYHPLYVLVHSLYYLLLQISLVFGLMFKDFNYSLQLVLGISGFYFLLILFWKPYHSAINVHNHFLKLNHASVVLFLSICYAFAKVQNLSNQFYIASMYSILFLVGLVIFGGFLRILIEKKFRKCLQSDNTLLNYSSNNESQKSRTKKPTYEEKPLLPKNFGMLAKNPYYFPNQVKQLSKKYKIKKQNQKNQDQLSMEEQIRVIEKIREQHRLHKENNFLIYNPGKSDKPLCFQNTTDQIFHHLVRQNSRKPPHKEEIQGLKQLVDPCLLKKVSQDQTPSCQIDQKQLLKKIKNQLRYEFNTNFY